LKKDHDWRTHVTCGLRVRRDVSAFVRSAVIIREILVSGPTAALPLSSEHFQLSLFLCACHRPNEREISHGAARWQACLTLNSRYVQLNIMRAARLQQALERLTAAIRDVESELAAMKAEHDPLASHIFVSRRNYRNVNDTKSGKLREMTPG
jgi:hypothetical protein